MPQFSYRARRRSGEIVKGALEVAATGQPRWCKSSGWGCSRWRWMPPKAGRWLWRTGRPRAKDRIGGLSAADIARGAVPERKPKLQELATFTQQLANLLNSGMPLTVALNSMTHLETKGIPAEVSQELKQDVMEGRSLSDAMAKQPRIFSDLYINMVRAGESSGALVEVLRRMADHFERFAQVRSKFTSALIYPAFVSVVGIVHHVLFHDVHAAQVHDDFSRA